MRGEKKDMFCHNCGAEVEDGALFCGECGARQSETHQDVAGQVPDPSGADQENGKNHKNMAVIVMAVIIVVLLAVIGFLAMRGKADRAVQTAADEQEKMEITSKSGEEESGEGLSEATADEETASDTAADNADNPTAGDAAADNAATIRIGGSDQMTDEEDKQEDSDYLLPDSDKRYLQESDLEGFGAEELKLARNELYARYGRRFKDEALQAYFEEKEWYEGIYDPEEFPEDLLSDIVKYNRDFIVEYEKKMGYR